MAPEVEKRVRAEERTVEGTNEELMDRQEAVERRDDAHKTNGTGLLRENMMFRRWLDAVLTGKES